MPFVLKRQRKNFRNKRNASAQQEKREIAGICFRRSGMLLLTTTIQIKMLICSYSSIFKKICWLFPEKKKKFLAFREKPKIIWVKCIWNCWRNTIQTCSPRTAHCYNSDNVQQQAQLNFEPSPHHKEFKVNSSSYFHKLTSKAFICSFSGKNLLASEQSSDNLLQKHAACLKALCFVKELF